MTLVILLLCTLMRRSMTILPHDWWWSFLYVHIADKTIHGDLLRISVLNGIIKDTQYSYLMVKIVYPVMTNFLLLPRYWSNLWMIFAQHPHVYFFQLCHLFLYWYFFLFPIASIIWFNVAILFLHYGDLLPVEWHLGPFLDGVKSSSPPLSRSTLQYINSRQ